MLRLSALARTPAEARPFGGRPRFRLSVRSVRGASFAALAARHRLSPKARDDGLQQLSPQVTDLAGGRETEKARPATGIPAPVRPAAARRARWRSGHGAAAGEYGRAVHHADGSGMDGTGGRVW